ncbi:DsbA family protein [Nocardia zapadnayensis]|nr:thioredoxin domain-containing protein [Nocardia zapadnayensis]MCX0277042.1 DsbA family protein [Nocardia zapadnayensis]
MNPADRSVLVKSKSLVWILMAAAVIAAIVVVVIVRGNAPDTTAESATPAETAETGQLVRENSRVLSQAPNEKAVLVEFLDFECESCRAAYPLVEELRTEYADSVTFVHRYFPLPGHRNGMNAALAVEAAAQQGAYEPMYQQMFETQPEWGESADDKSAVFRSFAEDLGLDMAAYDQAVADPATQERVELDLADGIALNVSGTPTFFLDGQLLTLDSLEEFEAAVAAAAAD